MNSFGATSTSGECYESTFPQKRCPILIEYSKLSFLMTIHLLIFSNLYKSLFNLLFFLHLWIQRAFPSAKPILCVSVFYATTAFSYPQSLFSCFSVFYATAASAFPYPRSPFSLFLSFLCDHCLPFSLSGKACFLFLSFLRHHRPHFSLS